MADTYHLTAEAETGPVAGGSLSSGSANVGIPVDVSLVLTASVARSYELISDAPVTVDLPGPTSDNPDAPQANVLHVQVSGPRVKATITTADGTAQVVPVDSLLILHTTTIAPITALTLTRTPGNDTFVSVFAGAI